MKRYDEFEYFETPIKLRNTIDPAHYTKSELEHYITNNEYCVYVRCRNCNCIHNINNVCNTCGITSKITFKNYD